VDRLRWQSWPTLVRKIARQIEDRHRTGRNCSCSKKLDRIVNPRLDDMRRESSVLQCREILRVRILRHPSAKGLTSQLDRVSTAGQEAFEQKNIKKWLQANEVLRKIAGNMRSIGRSTSIAPLKSANARLEGQADRFLIYYERI